MSSFFVAKVTAYLLERMIMLPPDEAVLAFKDKPTFAHGKNLKSFCEWIERDLFNISELIWKNPYHARFIEGFKGTGVIKNSFGGYSILVYGSMETCQMMQLVIPSIKQKCQFDISCIETNEVEFAVTGASPLCCQGGDCILQPSGLGTGVLGAWLKRINDQRPVVGVTNNHVAAEYNNNAKGTLIYSHNKMHIGEIEKVIPLIPYKSNADTNLVDLALIRPKDLNTIDFSFLCTSSLPLGEANLENNYKQGNSDIILCADTSVPVNGLIMSFPVTFYVGHNPKYRFEDVIEIDIGQPGNSGALILDNSHYIGGIFFAVRRNGNRFFGYVNKWEYVRSESGVDFIL